jgi:stage V sporulation protein D (sporulation-specific penicillin-binding protein)
VQKASRKRTIRNAKLIFLGCVFTCALIFLCYRVLFYKVVYGAEYEKSVLDQIFQYQNTETLIPANNGSITDRNHESLALSYTVYNIILDVRRLLEQSAETRAATLETLGTVLEFSPEALADFVAQDPETGKPVHDTYYYVIARGVPVQQVELLKAADPRCVYVEENSKRAYPHGALAAQTVGFIRGENYWGLESTYKEYLAGTPGRLFRVFDAESGMATRAIEPQDGLRVITTLDTTIQTFAEEAVRQAAEEYQPQHSAILVMNPKTGEILAMAESDRFDLNNPADLSALPPLAPEKPLSDMDRLNALWGNYAIESTFEPGSIFKPIVVAAALEENIIAPEDVFLCYGSRTIGGTELQCWKTPAQGGHGKLNVTDALKHSCNVAMMDIAEKLGRDLFYKYQRDFGYGEKTGIDLPRELSVSSPSLLYSLEALRPTELATSSFGQGFNNTAMQAITAFSAIINGGNLMRPYLVSRIVDGDGNTVKENLPVIQRKVISQTTSDFMRAAMESVVTPDGTGRRAVINGYAIGGKTGTAQQGQREKEEYTLSFIAYFPVENPEYIALAIIDRPKDYAEGSTSAAPMLREVVNNIINYKGIRPTGEVSESALVADAVGEVVVENYIGEDVAMVSKRLNAKKFDFEFIGSGDIVSGQLPQPDTTVPEGTTIMLTLAGTGVDLFAVPFVVGLSVSVATDRLKSAGLDVYVEEGAAFMEPDPLGEDLLLGEPPEKYVDRQMPVSGGKVPPGTEVKLILK